MSHPEGLVVISDLHAHADKLSRLRSFYGPDIPILANGDVVDGEDTRRTLDLIGEYGVTLLAGNHELVLLASLQDTDDVARQVAQSRWRPRSSRCLPYENGTVSSYGIDATLSTPAIAEKLRDKMEYLGHLSILEAARFYYEADDFIVIHAGLDQEPWEDQRKQLDTFRMRFRQKDYSFALAGAVQIMDPDFSLSTAEEVNGTEKRLVTGHAHLPSTANRITANGQRIRLASRLHLGEPLYAWQSWDNTVHRVE